MGDGCVDVVFLSYLHRSAYFSFSEEVNIEGITGFRYVFPPAEINNQTIDPGFFPNGPNGVMNLSATQSFSKNIVMFPRFSVRNLHFL